MYIVALIFAAMMFFILYFEQRQIYNIFSGFNIKINKKIFALFYWVFIVAVFIRLSSLILVLMYSCMIFASAKLFKVIFRRILPENAKRILSRVWLHGLAAVISAVIILIYALINAASPVVTEYKLELSKPIENMDEINLVFFGDTHMGTVVDIEDLLTLVQDVNAREPDVICIIGDVLDERTPEDMFNETAEALGGLNAKYGVYAIMGNHDPAELVQLLDSAGITILHGDMVLVNDSFYIAGVADPAAGGLYNDEYAYNAADILADADKTKPIIYLQHRPGGYMANLDAGADIQLSGHTHSGQIFPGGLISRLVNEVNYGHKAVTEGNVIVTSGYGVWGMPVRTEGRSEYVAVTITGQ